MDFASMATNRLNTQAPDLSRYIVAFKDLSDELPDDQGIQCGMFILNIGGRYVYVPALSKAGNVQVLESMMEADSKTFVPITRKSVQWMIEKDSGLGEAVKIPQKVARNPDLYDAIVPPRTGKFVYASEGRIGGFFASLPNHVKQATLEVITNDLAFRQAVAPVMKLDIVKTFLQTKTPEFEKPMGPPAPEVITSAEGMDEEQIQEILSKGYTVKNPPKTTRIAVESYDNQDLSRLSSMSPGTANLAMRKDGSWIGVANLRMVPTPTSDPHTESGYKTAQAKTGIVAITEDGEILQDTGVVINTSEIKYGDVISKLRHKKAVEINKGDSGMIFTGAQWLGPIDVSMVTMAGGWTTIRCASGVSVCIHPNVKTLYEVQGSNYILSTSAMFYPTKPGMAMMETDVNAARRKNDIAITRMLPVQAKLMHRDGVYAVDGKQIDSKPELVEHLLKTWDIDVATVETLARSAEAKSEILVKMASRGSAYGVGSGAKRQEHYSQGDQPEIPEDFTGTARQRALGASKAAKSVRDVRDREVMEATIISEMLQNPDLAGTIDEYLPDIKQAVDRLGRSLFLMRLNTDKLSDKMDAEALNSIFTSTRNAYRILGENYVTLKNLIANDG